MALYHPRINNLTPYVPGEQPQNTYLKLNTNENPYPPSPLALAAMQAAINDDLRLYPDPNASELKAAIAAFYHLNSEQVFVGNGSDEVLAHAFCALFKNDAQILMPDISYSFYPVYCRLYDLPFKTVALDANFALNPNDYRQPNGGIIMANPNAPTGIFLELAQIAQILDANPNSVVIIDEAYIDFGGTSAVCLLEQYPNLLIVQTLSKSRALAGLRVGFALGNKDLIASLEKVKNSFNSYPLDKIAQVGAIAAIKDGAYLAQTCEKIIKKDAQITAKIDAIWSELGL